MQCPEVQSTPKKTSTHTAERERDRESGGDTGLWSLSLPMATEKSSKIKDSKEDEGAGLVSELYP